MHTIREITITFPLPVDALRPNNGIACRWGVSTARKKAHAAARMLTIAALGKAGLQELQPRSYRVAWYYRRGVGPDDDNVLASIKAHKDGMCEALHVNDRDVELVRVLRVKSTSPRVELTMSEATWAQAAAKMIDDLRLTIYDLKGGEA